MATLKQRTDGHVLIVELNRADRGNALDATLQSELAQAWTTFEADTELHVAVLHGAPDVFSIGHDVDELSEAPTLSPVPDDRLFPLHLSKPVIAAVQGPCYGLGFELALACDLRVATETARFGFADPHLFVPYRVASVLLPRMTFLGAGLDLILSGHLLSGAEMRRFGLVSDVVSSGEAVERSVALAHDMSRRFGGRDCRKQAIWRLSGTPVPAAMQMARALRGQ